MDIEAIKKLGLCVICGIKPDKKHFKDGKEKLSEKCMCKLCDNLADEKFYEFPNNFAIRKYFKDYLAKEMKRDERNDIDELFKIRPTTEWIHGIMPSKCPTCKNMATNKGIIQSFRIGSPQYEKVVVKNETPSLVCKACGDFTLYLNHVYGFSRQDSMKVLNSVCEMKEKNKKDKKLVCETCADECGFNDPKYTEEEKEIVKKTKRKILCKTCLKRLGETKLKVTANNAEGTKSTVQSDK